MTSTNPPDTNRPGTNRQSAAPSAKRLAILAAARTVFGRDGYARASIDDIAAEAGASTRTLYNHFGSKETLFTETMTASSTAIADAQIALLHRHLDHVGDLESALTALGFDLFTTNAQDDFAGHFAIVRQIDAESSHFPEASIRAWRDNGPRRVRRELAERLAGFADEGLLRITEPERAALHYTRLIAPDRDHDGPSVHDAAELHAIVADGVHAFLHGYTPRD